MRILVGFLLVVFLFVLFVIAAYYNRKTKCEKGFDIKGYTGQCSDCSVENCPIRQDEYKKEK